jgi:hypothetical protein
VRGRRVLGHQEGLGVGRLVVDLDPHVVDHADDAFDLLGVQHVVREVIVDLGVGQEPALLAENDQVLEARASRLGIIAMRVGLNGCCHRRRHRRLALSIFILCHCRLPDSLKKSGGV